MNPSAMGSTPVSPLGTAPRIRSPLFEIASRPPARAPRWTLGLICTLFGLLLAWAAFAELDIVAVAPGRLVPQTHVKIVQPAAAGIVREILVEEGDAVAEGEVLVRLDPTETAADRAAIERELAIQQLQLRRIDAELTGTVMDERSGEDPALFAQASAQQRANRQAHAYALTRQQAALERAERQLAAAREVVRKLELTQPSYRKSVEAYDKLEAKQVVGAIQAEEVRREAIENAQNLEAQRATVAGQAAAVQEATRELARLSSAHTGELQAQRIQIVSRIGQLEQERVKAAFQESNLELRAPQAGIVKELATTSLGAVVQPGTVLVSLVPQDEPLLAEVSIQNQDIGFVQPGQAVRLKLATYPFQRYGMLEGTVRTVQADAQQTNAQSVTTSDMKAGSGVASTMAFKATIALQQQALIADGVHLPLAAGMQLSAEIVEGRRTVLQYLLSPVQRVLSEAGVER